MSISNQTDKIFGTGDGTTTVFSFPFKIFAPTDLVVYEIDTTQTPNVSHTKTYLTDYSVSVNTVGEGGTVTFVVAPPLSWQTLIQRVEPFTQSLVLNTEGNLPAQQIENQLDLMTMLCIQVNEAVGRCPQLPITFNGTFPLTLPLPQPGLVLAWDPTGKFLVNVVATTAGNIALPIANANLAPLVNANMVDGSALYSLGSIVSGAGVIPVANIPTISAAGKVSGAALTSLSSIPSGAGVIPIANIPVSSIGGLFGTAVSKSVGTSYLAATDGIVIATFTPSSGNTMNGFANSTNPASSGSTIMVGNWANMTTGFLIFPVQKGQYYETSFSLSLSSSTMIFIPLGA